MGGPNFNATVTGNGNPGVAGTSSSDAGVRGTSTSGAGVHGSISALSPGSIGVRGTNGSLAQPVLAAFGEGVRGESQIGVRGLSETSGGAGVWGEHKSTQSGVGVYGVSAGSDGTGVGSDGAGVVGENTGRDGRAGYPGVFGTSARGAGVYGAGAPGVFGTPRDGVSNVGVYGAGSPGVWGTSEQRQGVVGGSVFNIGVHGIGDQHTGVFGSSRTGYGVFGTSSTPEGEGSGIGVYGHTDDHPSGIFRPTSGVWGHNANRGRGVYGDSVNGVGVYGQCRNPSLNVTDRRVGGLFDGGVIITNGLKPFTIDHPLDPENKYLVHTSVESSEMKNVYDGVARLDEDGAAWVDLPEWFEALNGDFRYQLTAVGGSAPDLHVAEEISENRFKIAGGQEGMKVCWQLTGSRKDPWAAANPFEVEQEKSEEERGRYLDPSLYDAPEEQRVLVGPIAEAVEEEYRRRIDESTRLVEEQRQAIEEPLREALPESP